MSTADFDGDSQMDSPSDSSNSSTPAHAGQHPHAISNPASSNISPPDSQQRNTSSTANANGKRPLNTISNGPDDEDDLEILAPQQPTASASGLSKPKQEYKMQTHQPSGYQWNRLEDEPGYAWLNKKALDEYNRAWDGLVHKEFMIRGRYGDPFEAVERERAIANSLKQK